MYSFVARKIETVTHDSHIVSFYTHGAGVASLSLKHAQRDTTFISMLCALRSGEPSLLPQLAFNAYWPRIPSTRDGAGVAVCRTSRRGGFAPLHAHG